MGSFIVTCSLPYANGPLHIGHLLEYIYGDIYARALKLSGKEVLFLCADDVHGSPIELAAKKAKKTPETFIKEVREERLRDLKHFFINFTTYSSTHTTENKKLTEFFFNKLNEKGYFSTEEIEQYYDEQEKRFLPDRYVKGICPKCRALDKYGDNCDSCGAVYRPTELLEPYSTLSGKKPVLKKSTHYFFKLTEFSSFLDDWLKNNKQLQSEAVNFSLDWIKKGLQNWDVSRDAPYFGFLIPGESSKYFYVWFDAPIGYIATLTLALNNDIDAALAKWQQKDIFIQQFVGKDIAYHHFLFWPAMLSGAELRLPDRISVHGFVNVNKEKMSKSRGTFITAHDFLTEQPAEFLRFFYASLLNNVIQDIDVSEEDFKEKINSGLVDNIANFVYRVTSFVEKHFERKIFKIKEDKQTLAELEGMFKQIKENYFNLNIKEATRLLLELASFGNKYFQENEPWKLINTDKKRCKEVVTLATNIVFNLSILLEPILPDYAQRIQHQFNIQGGFKQTGMYIHDITLASPRIIFTRIEDKALSIPESILFPLELRVAEIKEVKEHHNADKLFVLQVAIGKKQRQIVAGLRDYYTVEQLVGKKVIVVANLKPAKLRGEVSQGMMLAADNGETVILLESDVASGTLVVPEAMKHSKDVVSFEQFKELTLRVTDKNAMFNDIPFVADKKRITINMPDGTRIR